MTTTADPQAALAALMTRLTGPGGPFELASEQVLGSTMTVFKNRGRQLHEVLAASVAWGDREYLVSEEERITYREHAQRASSLAQWLREEKGVRPGDRVALAAANSADWITTFWAIVSMGAVAVGCNAWWSRREMEHAIALTEPRLVLADERRTPLLVGVSAPVVSMEGEVVPALSLHPAAPLPSCDGDEDDPAVILFTSGTSGRAKGAVHSHRNLLSVVEYHRLSDALVSAMGGPLKPEDRRYLLVLPLFHIASLHNLAIPRLATGSTVVLHRGAFDVDRVLRLVERERVTNWGPCRPWHTGCSSTATCRSTTCRR